jgi:hypothetical protein
LVREGIFPESELPLVRFWVEDLKRLSGH